MLRNLPMSLFCNVCSASHITKYNAASLAVLTGVKTYVRIVK